MSKKANARSKEYPLKRAKVMTVPCPSCGAPANKRCTGVKGQKRTTCHIGRWKLSVVSTFDSKEK